MKIVKLYSQNDLNIPVNYPQEIILNHPDNAPIPNGYIVLSDEEIELRIEQYKDQVNDILEQQRIIQEQEQAEQQVSEPVNDIINSIVSLSPEQLELLRTLIGGN